jgi:hypothetical protein
MRKYLIDSSSFIELEDRYPPDISFFKPIYEKIDQMFKDGKIFSINEVFKELEDSKDFWKEYKGYFRVLTRKESENVSEIFESEDFEAFINWGLKGRNKIWADPQLVACAMEDSDIVVVSEESSIHTPERKLPFVCDKKGIPYIKLLDLLRKIN